MNTRLQVHWAAQIVSSVGRTLIAPRADDSHTSFTWSDGALAGEPLEDERRTVLRVRDLTLVMSESEFPLRGKTLEEGFAFVEGALGQRLERPSIELPDHEVARGAVFDPEENELALLASLFDGAAEVLERFRASRAEAGPVLLWPHHFDIATLLDLGNGRFVGAVSCRAMRNIRSRTGMSTSGRSATARACRPSRGASGIPAAGAAPFS